MASLLLSSSRSRILVRRKGEGMISVFFCFFDLGGLIERESDLSASGVTASSGLLLPPSMAYACLMQVPVCWGRQYCPLSFTRNINPVQRVFDLTYEPRIYQKGQDDVGIYSMLHSIASQLPAASCQLSHKGRPAHQCAAWRGAWLMVYLSVDDPHFCPPGCGASGWWSVLKGAPWPFAPPCLSPWFCS